MESETPAEVDQAMMDVALAEARASLAVGGVPVGAALASGGRLISSGHNERVQSGDPIAHGEMSCLRNAGRQASYRDMTLYTTLSPCQMCTGAILLFQIPRVVVGEHHRDTKSPEEHQVPGEGGGLADDHSRDLEKQDSAGAHLARGQGRV